MVFGTSDQQLGLGASSLGDLDADGFDDFALRVVPREISDNWSSYVGDVYLFYGRRQFSERIELADADAVLGGPISGLDRVGDLNGDRHDDLILNGPDWVQIVFGSSQRLQGNVDIATLGVRWLGSKPPLERPLDSPMHVQPAGDVNGDGLQDLIVAVQDSTSPWERGSFLDPWRGHLILGRTGAWPAGVFDRGWASAAFDAQAPQPDTQPNVIGPSPIAAGDLDGDGYDDLLGYDSYYAMRLFYGGPDKLRGQLGTANADAILEHGGTGLSPVGDANGDGCSELATAWTGAATSIVYGRRQRSSGNVSLTGDLQIEFEARSEYDPETLGAMQAGDVDGDGTPDLVVANPGWSQLFVVKGGDLPASGVLRLTSEHLVASGTRYESFGPENITDGMGTLIDARGDFDNDGSADVLVCAPGFQVFGDGSDGLPGGTVYLIPGSWQRPL